MVILIFNTSLSYADNSINYQEEYLVQTRSGTVAVGGAVASAILALATKVGVEFATNEDMHKFISDMVKDFNGVDVLNSVADAISYAGAGLIGLPASIVNTFCNYINSKNISNTSVSYLRFKGVEGQTHSIPVLPKDFDSTSKYGSAGMSLFKRICDMAGTDISVTFRNNGIESSKSFQFPNMALGFKYRVKDVLFANGEAGAEFGGTPALTGYTKSWNSSYSRVKCFIAGVDAGLSSRKDYEIILGYVFYNPALGIQNGVGGYMTLAYGRYWFRDVIEEEVVDPRPSMPSGIVQSPGESNIAIPSNPSDLIGKTPSDIVDVPSYEVWSPGSVVVPPVSDSTDITYTPDLSVPSTPADAPGDSGSTSTPGDSSTSTPGDSSLWNWLKELLQSILDLIRSILDWLTNFWTNLLEFIKSLFIVSDGYFTDKLSEILSSIESKIPNIDISKIKDLAVGEYAFKDVYATFFGIRCLVVRGSVINDAVAYAKPILQGLIALFLLLYNYNQVYKLIRGGSIVGSTCNNDNRG